MDIDTLNYKERGLIEILRAFSFLHQETYHEEEINLSGRSKPSVMFYSYLKNRIVRVVGDESESWTIIIQRKRFFVFKRVDAYFDISDYYSAFGSGMIKGRNYTLKSQVDFIQQHLMPVIKGEVWIDELMKKKKIGQSLQ